MSVSDFTGSLDVRERITDGLLRIRAADPRVAVSRTLMQAFHANPNSTWNGRHLAITGIDGDGQPTTVVYQTTGFDLTAHPEANEGGFHLLERVDSSQEAP